jgi:tRNA G18 (ribose-2'-O)-methylase SpoU
VTLERLVDPADPRLRDFTDLRDVQLRSVREPAEGLFVAEGEATIARALAAGYRPRAGLGTERFATGLAQLLGDDVTIYVVDEAVLETTTGFPVHRGALASFVRRPLPEVEALLEGAARIALLQDLTDHTNLGAIFRSAAAFGWDAVLLSPRCADPLYRRAIRTSMGAVFTIPWSRLPDGDAFARLRASAFVVAALTPSAEAAPIDEVVPPRRLALALGTEGPGLSQSWLAAADLRVRIPMRGGIDSLNVGAAAAVAFHVLARR